MKSMNKIVQAAAIILVLGSASVGFAKSYQVTGPVVDVSDSTLTVDKKGEKFEIARPAGMGGDLKKGMKVTVQYSMTATEIEIKAEGSTDKKEKKSKK